MAYFLFIDESGQDHRESPYEVLAGVAVEDRVLWDMIQEMHVAEIRRFGRRYSAGVSELKGKKLLKSKTFRLANHGCEIPPEDVAGLAKECLDNGREKASVRHLKALAKAKIEYVFDVFSICERYRCKIFVSIVDIDAPQTSSDGLRKDYAYLFERFFYFLEDQAIETAIPQHGIIVFDELEKSQSHVLIDQSHRYFKDTATGRHRASFVVPEPFFVHSDLTTGVQVADLVAYCMSWGFRLRGMTKPKRAEIEPYAAKLAKLRYRAVRNRCGISNFEIWSIAHITDLRTNAERIDE